MLVIRPGAGFSSYQPCPQGTGAFLFFRSPKGE